MNTQNDLSHMKLIFDDFLDSSDQYSIVSDIPSLKSDDGILDYDFDEAIPEFLSSPSDYPRISMELDTLIDKTLDLIMHERDDYFVPDSYIVKTLKLESVSATISDYEIITGHSPSLEMTHYETLPPCSVAEQPDTSEPTSQDVQDRRPSFATKRSMVPVTKNNSNPPKYVKRMSLSHDERMQIMQERHSASCCDSYETCPKKTFDDLVGFFDRRSSVQKPLDIRLSDLKMQEPERKSVRFSEDNIDHGVQMTSYEPTAYGQVDNSKISPDSPKDAFGDPLELIEDYPVSTCYNVDASTDCLLELLENDPVELDLIPLACEHELIENEKHDTIIECELNGYQQFAIIDENEPNGLQYIEPIITNLIVSNGICSPSLIAGETDVDTCSEDADNFLLKDQKQKSHFYPRYVPTAIGEEFFNSIQDVYALHEALNGVGTDQKTLVAIIFKRSREQLRQVQFDYKTLLGRDLKHDVRMATDGNLRDLLVAALGPIHHFFVNHPNAQVPSLIPYRFFNELDDINALCKAIHQSDQKCLIAIICRRSNDQLQTIQNAYNELGYDLYKDVRSVTKGTLRDILSALLLPRALFYANEKHKALDALDLNEDTLIEILCSLSNSEPGVQERYLKIYERKVQEDTVIGNRFLAHLTAMCYYKRDDSDVDTALARLDAADLLVWPFVRVDRDGNVFDRILTLRSFAHIRMVNQCCQMMGGRTLLDIVVEHLPKDEQIAFTTLVTFALDSNSFYAARLHKCLCAGLLRDDQHLIRTLVMRCEIDLSDIREQFELSYGKTLSHCIKERISPSHYRSALLSLIDDKEVNSMFMLY